MKYVFVGIGTDDIKHYYSDFDKNDYSELVMLPSSILSLKLTLLGKLIFCLQGTCFENSRLAKRQRRLFNIADYRATNKKLLRKYLDSIKKVKKEDEVCFIIYARIYENSGTVVLKELKKRFPKARFVVYFGDLMSSFGIYSVERLKNDFERVYSFDEGDCRKYGFKYLQEPFSYLDYGNYTIDSDLSFIGAAKNRLNDIYKAYEKSKTSGLKNDFYIFNVKDEEQKYKDEIKYNCWLSFSDVMEHSLKSKAILEVVQKGAFSPTTRYSEAMLYKKYLITNCEAFRNCEKLPNNIIYYESIDDIDFEGIKKPLEYDNSIYVNELSINTFIRKIEEDLN